MTTNTEINEDIKSTAVIEPSKYLAYLPALFSEDEFMGRFLRIFEDMLTPIEEIIEHIDLYFDPRIAPAGLLQWLASWVNLVLDEGWPLEKRRQLIGSAVELYQLRGTRRGLTEYLGIYTGVDPVITEYMTGFKLGEMSQLGWSTILGEGQDHFFTVTLELDETSTVDVERVRAIIESEKPAHAAYRLDILIRKNNDAPENMADI